MDRHALMTMHVYAWSWHFYIKKCPKQVFTHVSNVNSFSMRRYWQNGRICWTLQMYLTIHLKQDTLNVLGLQKGTIRMREGFWQCWVGLLLEEDTKVLIWILYQLEAIFSVLLFSTTGKLYFNMEFLITSFVRFLFHMGPRDFKNLS